MRKTDGDAATRHRVLVVDDQKVMRSVLASMLSREGYDVFQAEDGLGIEAIVEAEGIDAVVMDVNMPGRDGIESTRALRQDFGSLLPVVLVTGSDDKASRREGKAAGADDFLTKPRRSHRAGGAGQEPRAQQDAARRTRERAGTPARRADGDPQGRCRHRAAGDPRQPGGGCGARDQQPRHRGGQPRDGAGRGLRARRCRHRRRPGRAADRDRAAAHASGPAGGALVRARGSPSRCRGHPRLAAACVPPPPRHGGSGGARPRAHARHRPPAAPAGVHQPHRQRRRRHRAGRGRARGGQPRLRPGRAADPGRGQRLRPSARTRSSPSSSPTSPPRRRAGAPAWAFLWCASSQRAGGAH